MCMCLARSAKNYTHLITTNNKSSWLNKTTGTVDRPNSPIRDVDTFGNSPILPPKWLDSQQLLRTYFRMVLGVSGLVALCSTFYVYLLGWFLVLRFLQREFSLKF